MLWRRGIRTPGAATGITQSLRSRAQAPLTTQPPATANTLATRLLLLRNPLCDRENAMSDETKMSIMDRLAAYSASVESEQFKRDIMLGGMGFIRVTEHGAEVVPAGEVFIDPPNPSPSPAT